VGNSALVLGAGGITGIAWQLGVLTGLSEAGVDVTGADLIVGTSAGSVVGTLLAAGIDPRDGALLEHRPAADDPPIEPDWPRGTQAYMLLNDDTLDLEEIRVEVGALALEADVIGEDAYLRGLARRLPIAEWPLRRLVITAVDAASGEPAVWDRGSGVPLTLAVAASCAVPCIFPPVTIDGRRYMDGGVRSGTNADLANDAERVVVLAPLAPIRMRGAPAAELDALREHAEVALVAPDETVLDVLGPNLLDPSVWEPAITAAIAQGHRVAPAVGEVWRA
jgi:NTE family protein